MGHPMQGAAAKYVRLPKIAYPDASEDRDRFAYGYDRNSNRTWRTNAVTAGLQTPVHLDEAYTYDRLDRLVEAHRGNLDQNHAIPAANRDYGEIWTLSPTGNWSTYKSLSE